MLFVKSLHETDAILRIGGNSGKTKFYCPNCDLPFTKIAFAGQSLLNHLNVKFTRNGLDFYYCWRCDLKLSPFTYRASGRVYELQSYQEGVGDGYVYAPYPASFNEINVSLRPLSHDELIEIDSHIVEYSSNGLVFKNIDDYVLRKHDLDISIGTFYYNSGGKQFVTCENCKVTAEVVVTIPGIVGENNFAGSKTVVMVFGFCVGCNLVTAFHYCD